MSMPTLSHLQFVVLGTLRGGSLSGPDLRARLAERGVRKSGPAFYQLMARLEDGESVEGWYERKSVGGQTLRERHYRITPRGAQAWDRSRDFYLETIRDVQPGIADA